MTNTNIYLKAIASSNPPNWTKQLSQYKSNWPEAIDATVIDSDQDGPTVVAWAGHAYIRRSSENKKYGAAIWFSRADGRDESGEANYVRLITFREKAVPRAEPLPEYVRAKLG